MSENINTSINPGTAKKKNRKMFIIIGAAAAAVAVVAAAVCLLAFGSTETFDITEYLGINVDGYNGYAVATADINPSDIDKAIRKYINSEYGDELEKAMEDAELYGNGDKYSKKYAEAMTLYTVLSECIGEMECTLSKEANISNGDVIELTVSFKEEYVQALKEIGYKIKAEKITLAVEGLKTADVIDPFEYVTVDFEGPSGFAKAKVNIKEGINDKKDNFTITSGNGCLRLDYSTSDYSLIHFSVSANDYLKNGEKVTVVAYSHDLKEGTVLAQTEKEFVITAKEAFATADEVSEHIDAIYTLHSQNKDYVTAQGGYILTPVTAQSQYSNRVIAVFKYESTGIFSFKYYYTVEFTHCYIDGNNQVQCQYKHADSTHYDTAEKAFAAIEATIDTNFDSFVKV